MTSRSNLYGCSESHTNLCSCTHGTLVMAFPGVMSLTHHTSLGNDLIIALVNVLCLNVYKLACAQGKTRVGPVDH